MMWEREDLIYFAGLFDGEGCLSIVKRKGKGNTNPTYWLQLVIGMTHEPTIRWLHTTFGGDYHRYIHKIEAHSPCHIWRVSCKTAVCLLSQIEPFLRTKKTQAECALQFCEFNEGISKGLFPTKQGYKLAPWVIEKREEYFQRIRKLRKFA